MISLSELLGSERIYQIRTKASGPAGKLPLDADMLLHQPSGNLFGWTQNAGMGWNPAELGRKQFLILSTEGGRRAPDGSPIALGYHTGHWEIGLLVEAGKTLHPQSPKWAAHLLVAPPKPPAYGAARILNQQGAPTTGARWAVQGFPAIMSAGQTFSYIRFGGRGFDVRELDRYQRHQQWRHHPLAVLDRKEPLPIESVCHR